MAETIGFNPEVERNNKIEMIKVELVKSNFLKPDEKQKDQMSENLGRIFNSQLKHGTESVAEMEATIKGVEIKSHTEAQAKMAEEDKKILGEAVVLATRELTAEDPALASELFLGSKHVDNLLPKELKGLGREITRPLIGNEEIDKQLNLLEVTRQKTDLENPDSVKTLSQKIEMGIDKLIHKDFDTEEEIEQQDAVLTILNEEKRKLLDKNGFSNKIIEDVDFEPPVKNEKGEWEGGSRWEISPEYAAEAMKFMDSGMRWQSYTPPEWFKKIKPTYNEDGSIKETAGDIQARIEYMVMVNDGAASLSYAGKDLDKIQGNKMYFAFDNEKMTKLFNPDFKLVMSKMLNDLCEPYTDKNGQKCIRYKEGLNQDKKPGIKADVEIKLENIRDYKEEMATFLAEQNNTWEKYEKDDKQGHKKGDFVLDNDGNKVPDYMCKMNAYTAWNLFYMFGDSSVADRRRVLPAYGGIICDGLRTLNPEYKALGKWKISKADERKSSLKGAEWFGGPLGTYVQTVMQLERDLGRDGGKDKPITGNKTLRDKIIDREMSILNTKTFYGFLDFTSGGRDLYDENEKKFYDTDEGTTRKETLSSLLMNYGFEEGKLKPKEQREEFSFGHNQVDFLNWYRDQMEASALVLNVTTGKEDVKNIKTLVSKIRTAFGMVDGIEINGNNPCNYTKSPDLWANMLLGSFGIDMQRLSTDCIYIRTTQPRAYNLNLGAFLTRGLKLSENDVDLTKLMKRLGMDINYGENYDSLAVTIRNEIKWKQAKKVTDELFRRSRKN